MMYVHDGYSRARETEIRIRVDEHRIVDEVRRSTSLRRLAGETLVAIGLQLMGSRPPVPAEARRAA
jgi:hypothetical protein